MPLIMTVGTSHMFTVVCVSFWGWSGIVWPFPSDWLDSLSLYRSLVYISEPGPFCVQN